MNKHLLGGAAAAAIFAIAPASGQQPAPPVPPAAPRAETIRMERMNMKAQTRDAVVAHVRDTFAKFDTSRDGYVTKEEAEAARRAMGGEMREKFAKRLADRDLPKPDRGAMFDRLDSNRDGTISRQEFMSAQPQINERRVFAMREGADGGPGAPGKMRLRGMGMRGKMFETADANRDGRVSLQEMTDAALQRFDAADANRDGTLTPDERMRMRQQKKARRMQPA